MSQADRIAPGLRAAVKESIEFVAPRHDYEHRPDEWCRRLRYEGQELIVGVERGRRVRIAFKPRGPGAYGFKWHGFVRNVNGSTIWGGEVAKSSGCAGLVFFAAYEGKLPKPKNWSQPS